MKTTRPRRAAGTVRITADTEGIGPFEIPVTQEGKPEFDSTLAEDVDFGTLTSGNYVIVYLTKNEEQAYAFWDLRFWSDGVTFDMNTGTYSGSGDLVTVYLVSEPVYKNDDSEYYLPDGTYTVGTDIYSDPSRLVPGNISGGYRTPVCAVAYLVHADERRERGRRRLHHDRYHDGETYRRNVQYLVRFRQRCAVQRERFVRGGFHYRSHLLIVRMCDNRPAAGGTRRRPFHNDRN